MPSFDPMVLDSDNGLSNAIGTETLAAHDFVPEEQEDAPSQPFRSQGLPVRLIHGNFIINSATTIRRWIIQLHEKQRLSIQKRLAKTRSRVHISFIIPERNALGDDLIEALECLKAWWDHGFVQRG
jgi:hypothetical protein